MTTIKQIEGNPKSIEINGEIEGAVYYAMSNGNMVSIFHNGSNQKRLGNVFSEIEINGEVPSSAQDAVINLNSFIGLGFRKGGDSTPVITIEEIVFKLQEADNRLQLLEAVNPITPIVYDVTKTFTIPTNGRIAARLTKGSNQSGVDTMEIIGVDTSGKSNPVIILVPFGMGYDGLETQGKSKFFPQENNVDGDAANTKTTLIEVTPETANLQTQIIIPADCPGFTIKYFVGGMPHRSSYYVTADGRYHPFEIDNTPINNFYLSSGSIYVNINGNHVDKKTITEITFGDSYNTVTAINNLFLYQCTNLIKANFIGFSGVKTIGDSFLRSCVMLSGDFDFGVMPNLESIGNQCLQESRLTNIEFSNNSKLRTIGHSFAMSNTYNLKTVDFSGLSSIESINGQGFITNTKNLVSINFGDITADKISSDIPSTMTYYLAMSVFTKASPSFATGIQIIGTDRDNIMAKFPNYEDTGVNTLYRKLIA